MVSAFFLWLKYHLKTLGSYFSFHTLTSGCHYITGMDKEKGGIISTLYCGCIYSEWERYGKVRIGEG